MTKIYRLTEGDVIADLDGHYHLITSIEDGLAFSVDGHLAGGYQYEEIGYFDVLSMFEDGAQVLEDYGQEGWHLWSR